MSWYSEVWSIGSNFFRYHLFTPVEPIETLWDTTKSPNLSKLSLVCTFSSSAVQLAKNMTKRSLLVTQRCAVECSIALEAKQKRTGGNNNAICGRHHHKLREYLSAQNKRATITSSHSSHSRCVDRSLTPVVLTVI